MKEAFFYHKLENDRVRCSLCPWNCRVSDGETGMCGVRKNEHGTFYSLSYDNVASGTPDPIEKKPFFHFAPGTRTYSICTPGCNWKCKYCQNWQLSQGSLRGESIKPEQIVKAAEKSDCQGISYTYTEPTVFFELAYETAKLAKKAGLYNTFVTNGYINPDPIDKIAPYLDAVTVDFKGSGEESFLESFASVPTAEPIFTAVKDYYQHGIHLEITDLLVPRVGDSIESLENLINWILDKLGPQVPIHFLRFHPAYKVKDLPRTDLDKLKEAKQVAETFGLKYVYLGNVRASSDVVCPACSKKVVTRRGTGVKALHLEQDRCSNCGEKINISGLNWVETS